MLAIVSALHCEAAALIAGLALKRVTDFHGQHIFQGPAHILIESGVGKLPSAIAAIRLIDFLTLSSQGIRLSDLTLINIGVAAARPDIPIGSICLINALKDHASQESAYPDILLRHKLLECTLETFDTPVSDVSQLAADSQLADMEAFGFYQAAASLLSPNRIAILKIASDHFSPHSVNAQAVRALFKSALPQLIEWLSEMSAYRRAPRPSLVTQQSLLLEHICLQLRLTQRQRQILMDKAKAALVRNQAQALIILEQRLPQITDKHVRTSVFKELLEQLNHVSS